MSTSVKKKTCFVASPIGAENSDARLHADWLYQEIIENVIEGQFPGMFHLTRADKISSPGMIDRQIIEHLLDDDVVIADMSAQNPNVFYELGIRHMIEKPVIHMHMTGTDIPFDVKPFRSIEFSYAKPGSLLKARTALKDAIQAVLSPSYSVINPVILARGVQRLPETAATESEILISKIDSLSTRLKNLEIRQNSDATTRAIANALLAGSPSPVGAIPTEPLDPEDFAKWISASNEALNLTRIRLRNRQTNRDEE